MLTTVSTNNDIEKRRKAATTNIEKKRKAPSTGTEIYTCNSILPNEHVYSIKNNIYKIHLVFNIFLPLRFEPLTAKLVYEFMKC